MRMTIGRVAGLPLLFCALAGTALGQATSSTKPEVVIGGEHGLGGELVGPQTVLLYGQSLLVLEREAPFLKLFTLANGRLRQSVGRLGSGPGEFRSPSALAVDTQGRQLIVFDPANGRATTFRLGDTLTLDGTRSVPLHVEDACFADRRLYVLGLHEGHLVHELASGASELRKVRSIGRPAVNHPLADHPMFQDRVAQGVILCKESASQVIIGSLSVGSIHVLDLVRGQQATFMLQGFIPLRFEAVPNGLRQSLPAGGQFDEVVGLHWAAGGVRVVTGRGNLAHHGRDDYLQYSETLLSLTGDQRIVGRTRWREIGRYRDRTICYQATDYPTVAVFRTSRCP